MTDTLENVKPNKSPLAVRAAEPKDYPAVIDLLAALELDYPERDLSLFRVGVTNDEIIAIAELKDFGNFSLLSCVGVREDIQGAGIGKIFTSQVLREAKSDVYLYTLVPGFFEKLGFVKVLNLPPGLPPRSYYGCVGCEQLGCTCMVKVKDASRLPGV